MKKSRSPFLQCTRCGTEENVKIIIFESYGNDRLCDKCVEDLIKTERIFEIEDKPGVYNRNIEGLFVEISKIEDNITELESERGDIDKKVKVLSNRRAQLEKVHRKYILDCEDTVRNEDMLKLPVETFGDKIKRIWEMLIR